MQASTRDPAVWILGGLALVLIPAIVLLASSYPSKEERLKTLRTPAPSIPAPSPDRLLELVHQAEPTTAGLVLKRVYTPASEPVRGISAVYDLVQGEEPWYRLVLFRHDIACEGCKDILGAALCDVRKGTFAQVLLIEPWELEGKTVDARAFIAQFAGKPWQTKFQAGKNVAILPDAAKYSQGLIRCLNVAEEWLAGHVSLPHLGEAPFPAPPCQECG